MRTSPTCSSCAGRRRTSPTRRRRRSARLFDAARRALQRSGVQLEARAGAGGHRLLDGRGLGPQFDGDLFVGFSVPEPLGGPLFRFNLTGNRRKIAFDDPRLEDRVADNLTFTR